MGNKSTPVLSADQLKAKWAMDAAAKTAAAVGLAIESPTVANLPKDKDEMGSLLDTILREERVEPLREILSLYRAKRDDGTYLLSIDQRVAIMEKLMPYRYPKYKTVAPAQHGPRKVTIVIKQSFGGGSDKPDKIINVGSTPLIQR